MDYLAQFLQDSPAHLETVRVHLENGFNNLVNSDLLGNLFSNSTIDYLAQFLQDSSAYLVTVIGHLGNGFNNLVNSDLLGNLFSNSIMDALSEKIRYLANMDGSTFNNHLSIAFLRAEHFIQELPPYSQWYISATTYLSGLFQNSTELDVY